jgi:hypothetical protein
VVSPDYVDGTVVAHAPAVKGLSSATCFHDRPRSLAGAGGEVATAAGHTIDHFALGRFLVRHDPHVCRPHHALVRERQRKRHLQEVAHTRLRCCLRKTYAPEAGRGEQHDRVDPIGHQFRQRGRDRTAERVTDQREPLDSQQPQALRDVTRIARDRAG